MLDRGLWSDIINLEQKRPIMSKRTHPVEMTEVMLGNNPKGKQSMKNRKRTWSDRFFETPVGLTLSVLAMVAILAIGVTFSSFTPEYVVQKSWTTKQAVKIIDRHGQAVPITLEEIERLGKTYETVWVR